MSNSTTTRYTRPVDDTDSTRRPHHIHPTCSSARVVLTIKNWSKVPGVCHIGLGVTAMNTMKVLRRNGIHCEAWATQTYEELKHRLEADMARNIRNNGRLVTHIVVSAPSWINPAQFGEICFLYPEVEFVQLNHSGCAFLSIDKFGIRNIRGAIDLSLTTHNMFVAGNNPRFTIWAGEAFGFKPLLLPNLYDTDSFIDPPPVHAIGDTLRIGSFGASRPWKNQLTVAEAAVQMARRLGMRLELYVNSMRPDGGERMIESRKELFDDLAGCSLIDVPWQMWPEFRSTVHQMHLLFSPSFDETFNVVTADGIAEGVPSVTASAIEWTPSFWQVKAPEDPSEIMNVGIRLLHDPNAINEARRMLKSYVVSGVGKWLDFILHREQGVF